ncbi:MAG: hypothetical protein R3F56_26470 [Planctomycetota bacterium]
MPRVASLLVFLPLGAAGTLFAQARGSGPVLPSFTPAFTSPIRSAPTPDGGLWASGERYKVSFADGMAFYPCLGPAYATNLPLRWRTVAVGREGGETLPLASAAPQHGDYRFELVHQGWREVYDVLPQGLEQSFVIDRLPAGEGPLVVRGRVDTPLRHPVGVASAHQALTFTDAEGRAIVTYGEAYALDARGGRLRLSTEFDAGVITLRVPAAWLAQAALPITVDPILTPVVLQTSTLGEVASTDVVAQSQTLTRNLMFVCTRAFSATDHDVYGWLADSDFGNSVLVLRDLGTSADDRVASVAFVDGGPRWVVAYEHGYSLNGSPSSTIQVYFHDLSSTVMNSGSFVPVPQSTPAFLRNPDVGGTQSQGQTTSGYVVFTSDPTSANGTTTSLRRLSVNAAARTIGTPVTLGTGTADREAPAINQISVNGEGWLAVWQQQSGAAWSIVGAYFNVAGVQWESTIVISGARNFTQPQVAGSGTAQYTVTFVGSTDLTSTAGSELLARYVRRTSPYLTTPARSIATAAPPLTSIQNGGLAFNHSVGGTSLATYTIRRVLLPTTSATVYAARLGSSGGRIENLTVASASGVRFGNPSTTFVRGLPGEFPIVYGSNETTLPLYGARYQYPAAASTAYGGSCGSATLSGSVPLSGNGNFQVVASSLPASVPATLTFAAAPSSIPLDFLGMTGCTMNYDPSAFLANLAASSSSGGTIVFGLPLPDAPPIYGDLYLQLTYVHAGANVANLEATRGLHLQIR